MAHESRNSGATVDVHCQATTLKHNRSLKVAVQGLNFMAHPLYIYSQRLSKQVPEATSKQATIEVLLSYNDGKGVFCWIRPDAI
jgi:hypothetical protein